MDDLKKTSLIFKLSQLKGRVSDLNEQADGQVEILNMLSKSIEKIVEELENEKDSGEREV